jgi:hypothetical protein
MRRSTIAFLIFLSLAVPAISQTKSPAVTKSEAASMPPVTPEAGSSASLPVKRVVLYKNGVGYFEHMAHVRGTQELNIDFTSAQLNDVLKSLTAVDLGDGRITSVRYNSIAPLSERLRSLRLPFGEQITRAEFLTAMRGARVDVRSGASTATGRLLSVETARRQDPKGNFVDVTEFSIITDAGEMKNFELGSGTSVRIADHDLDDEIGRYLNLVGSARARDVRRMTLTAAGSGDRDIFVSYISEVPIWKSTYRIIFSDKPNEKPLLQGWAIVDNTIGEDWKDVQLSLVAGAPQSFIQDISQPFYARRPVVPLPQSVMLTPQTHEATVDRLEQFSQLQAAPPPPPPPMSGRGGVIAEAPLASLEGVVKDQSGAIVPGARITVRNEETGVSQIATTDQSGHYRFSNIQAGNSALFVNAPGFERFDLTNFYLGVGRTNEIDATLRVGAASEAVEVQAAAMPVETSTAEVSSRLATQSSEAEGKSIGDFFEYDIKQKISIGKNQSALVPILQSRIEADKVTLWTVNGSGSDDDDESSDNDDASSAQVPLRAIWIKNTSGQVFDAGTFNVLEADTFAGEGIMGSIHPDERRLLSYAADPAVHVKSEEKSSEKPYSRITIAKGLMMLTKEERRQTKFTIRDADKTPRVVVIEYPAEDGWDLTKDTPKPEESSASFHRFRVPVEAGETAELTVEAVHPDETQYALTNLNSDEVELLVKQARVTPAMQQAFDQILSQKSKIADLDQQINQRNQESAQISTDQARIRENMKALKGSAEERALIQRYTGELNSQEDRLDTLRKEMEDLRDKRVQASAELDRMIMGINLDESF